MPTRAQYESYLDLPQIRAALDTIAWAEGADYNTLYGGGTFSGNQHPNRSITAGGYTSTAAGRYQFLTSTWRSLGLPDFSPRNQDIGALMLMERRGGLDEVLAGNFEAALRSGALGREWASLPFSPYGQTNRTVAQVMNYYNGALAVYGGTAAPAANVNYSPGSSPTAGNNELLLYGMAAVLIFLLLEE